jgi:hypothetical protein
VVLTGTRAYDATTTAAAGILSVSNKVGADDVTVASGSGTLSSAAVGTNAIASFGTLTLGGVKATNYTLTGAAGNVTVTNPHTPFAITSAGLDNTGTNLVTVFQSVPGAVYQLLGASDPSLLLSNWSNVGSPITASAATTTNITPVSPPTKYYIYKNTQ